MIKTRFAPSPTGELHIGGARTALFAYLFAKHEGGDFLLRIEDTDRERFVEGATERIIEAMKWLGIITDNVDEPMIQSERKETYKKHALELVEKGAAYICTCTKERLEELRKDQEAKGTPTGYDRHCRELSNNGSRITNYEKLPEGAVIRLKMPESGKIVVNDLIRGKVEFDTALQDDPIIMKSDGFPTYHLAVVVDDHDMGITHVIRAEEWLSSTPKHHTLYDAFGWPKPEFAHLPMILGPDKKKLSKRHGATAVLDYRKEGYLPEAIVNFIALLGWNPKDEREEFDLKGLVKEFKIENVQKSPAVFNVDKLNSINERYIRELGKSGELGRLEILGELGMSEGELELAGRGGFKTLKEIANYVVELRKEPEYPTELLVFKKSDRERTLVGLKKVLEKMKKIKEYGEGKEIEEDYQRILEKVVLENGLANGDVFWPVRVALSGAEKSPSPVELMLTLGKDESLKRIERALGKIQ